MGLLGFNLDLYLQNKLQLVQVGIITEGGISGNKGKCLYSLRRALNVTSGVNMVLS
uniref:Uncharacterized protein n=1 Tax=Picea glauca TaxID=3330 RepID=A0A101M023_PICGL|nr:hypothetical protein ABT39_MTgene4571 [Picea glauca]QHR91969.1 hypothetical protein Q903MT_gene6005 [Picea sitchensis]